MSDLLTQPSGTAVIGLIAGEVLKLPAIASERRGRLIDCVTNGGVVRERSHDECELRPAGLNAWLPRTAQDRKVGIQGTSAIYGRRLGDDVLGVVSEVWFEGEQLSRPPSWADLRQCIGRCVLTTRVDRTVDELSRRFQGLGVLDEDDVAILDLSTVTGSAAYDMTRGMQSAGGDDRAVPPRRFQITIAARRADDQTDELEPLSVSTIDQMQLVDKGDSCPILYLRVVAVGNATPHAFPEFMRRISTSVQVVLANWRRLDCASDYFRRQVGLFKAIRERTSSPTERLASAREIVDLRADLALMTCNWTQNVEYSNGSGRLEEELDRHFALTPRWRDALQRQEGFGQLVQSAMELPEEEPPAPPKRREDEFGWVREGNPFRQLLTWRRERRSPTSSANRRGVPTKIIALHPYANRDAIFQEMQGTLFVTTMLTATTGIILGLLLQQGLTNPRFGSLRGIPVEIIYLFVATFAFFLSTLIATNAMQKLARETTVLIDVDLDRAAVVAEYLGKYPFLVALPLAVIRYFPNPNITLAVAILAWATFVAYHGFERIARIYRDFGEEAIGTDEIRDAIVYFMFALLALLLVFARFKNNAGEISCGIIFLVLLVVLTSFAVTLASPSDRDRMEVDAWDELGKEVRISVPREVSEASKIRRSPTALHKLVDWRRSRESAREVATDGSPMGNGQPDRGAGRSESVQA